MDDITIKKSEKNYTLTIDKGSMISDAKQQLAAESNVDVIFQKWIYKGRILNDNNCTISDANIKENDTVIVMKTASSTPPTPSTTTSTSIPSTSIPSTPTTPILPSSVFTPPVSNPAFDEAMFLLLDSNTDTSVIENVINIINKIIINIVLNPHNDKYRKISKTNKAFSQKVQAVRGGEELMRSLSFQTVGDDYILQPSMQAWDNLIASKTKLDKFAIKLQQQSSSSSTTPTKVDATQDPQKLSSTNDNDKTLVALQQMLSLLALQQNTTTDGVPKCNNEKDNEKDNEKE